MTAAPKMPPVPSVTEWSCGLACLESLARERGLAFSQSDVIARHRERYPLWREKPGACALTLKLLSKGHWLIEWELMDLARHLGLAHGVRLLRDRDALRRSLADPSQAAIALTRRSWEGGRCTELNHALRVLDADGTGPTVMDPGRRLGGRVERLEWGAFLRMEPLVFGLELSPWAGGGAHLQRA